MIGSVTLQVLAQFKAPFMADEESMHREAASQIEAQIASTSLEAEPPDGRKKVGLQGSEFRVQGLGMQQHASWCIAWRPCDIAVLGYFSTTNKLY